MNLALPFELLLWGLLAGAAMATILEASQYLGLSRLSLPFLLGTIVTGDRNRAMIIGFAIYMLGGCAFALLYFWIFRAFGRATWWFGALVALPHAGFVLAVMLPLLPYVHPRMASEFDGPNATATLEPPGPFGLHYGRQTPLVTLAGHVAYGLILGAALEVPA